VVDEEELGETEREGIQFVYLAQPVGYVVGEDGHVRAVRFVRNKLGDPDEKGRRSPIAIAGTEFEMPCDTVLLALGQAPETSWLACITTCPSITTASPGRRCPSSRRTTGVAFSSR